MDIRIIEKGGKRDELFKNALIFSNEVSIRGKNPINIPIIWIQFIKEFDTLVIELGISFKELYKNYIFHSQSHSHEEFDETNIISIREKPL